MRTVSIDYSTLKTFDRVDVVNRGLFSLITRLVTGHTTSRRIPTHTGFFISLYGQILIFEMAMDGLSKPRLRLTPPSHYLNSPMRHILSVYRNPLLTVPDNQIPLLQQAFEDIRHGLEYDYKGLLAFVFQRVKENPKRAYCSEYYYLLTKPVITDYPHQFSQRVSPYDLLQYSEATGFSPVKNAIVNE